MTNARVEKASKTDDELAKLNMSTEIKTYEAELMTEQQKADALVIKSDEEYDQATEVCAVISEKAKEIDAFRDFLVRPLNNQVKSINDMFMPQVKYRKEVIGTIKTKMADYYEKKERAAAAEQARLDKIRADADAKRIAEGKEIIQEPVREVAEVQRTNYVGSARSTAKKKWTHEMISINELPDDIRNAILAEAWTKGIITSVVQRFVDAGLREIKGVRIFEKTDIVLGKTKR